VQRIFNTEVHSSTGVSPAQLVFGNSIDLDRGLFQPKHISEEKEASLSDWTAKLLNYQSRALTIARQTQSAKDDRHLAAAPDTQLTEYPDNSYVLVEYVEKPPSKLHPRLQGPYRVVSHVGSKYSLQNLVTDIISDFHVSRIRPYLYDAEFDEDPKSTANRDEQMFSVEAILEHTGTTKNRKELFFKVRWLGYGEKYDKWLPFKDLRHNSILHDYLTKNRMRSLIPK
jgi:hypothetical protein